MGFCLASDFSIALRRRSLLLSLSLRGRTLQLGCFLSRSYILDSLELREDGLEETLIILNAALLVQTLRQVVIVAIQALGCLREVLVAILEVGAARPATLFVFL